MEKIKQEEIALESYQHPVEDLCTNFAPETHRRLTSRGDASLLEDPYN